MWTQAEAMEVCRAVEKICPDYGAHIALTGGLLYKEGDRKDLDLVLYRIRQWAEIDFEGLKSALIKIGFANFEVVSTVWCTKATYNGKPVDIFRPEEPGSGEDYPATGAAEFDFALNPEAV